MGSGIPLLNDYKEEFFWRRFLQTLLGGPKLRLGYDAPPYVYVMQVVLFSIPLILGIVFTILAETGLTSDVVAVCIYGGMIGIFALVVQLASMLVQRRETTVSPLATNTQNMLAEDDEIFFESCCSVGTVEFIIPGKKYKVNIFIHAAIAGVVGGLGFWYLLPTTLDGLYNDMIGVTIILYITGWLTLCVALYSVAIAPPPEVATFRTSDTWEIAPLMRPFYILLFACFDQLARHNADFVTTNEILHVVFVFLPLLWIMGLMPPLEALFLWAVEQMVIFLFGGSAMASSPRLVLMLLLSSLIYLLVYFVPFGLQSVAMMAVFGVLLSCEHGIILWVLDLWQRSPVQHPSRQHHWGYYLTLFALPVLACGVATATNHFYIEGTVSTDAADYVAYGIVGLFGVELLLAKAQTVYLFGGLWRNPLYPPGVMSRRLVRRRRGLLAAFGDIRRVIMSAVAPLSVVIYLSLSVDLESSDKQVTNGNTTHVPMTMVVMGTARAFRWAWQTTHLSLYDVTITFLVNKLATDTTTTWRSLGVGLQLLIVSVIRDRLEQFVNKLHFCVTLLVKSWVDKKQRHRSTVPTLGLYVILFPLLLATIFLAAVLSAPMLPLFTLPIFLIGYPRPLRSWPGSVGQSASECGDTAFYKHAALELTRTLPASIARGSLGDVGPGSYFLLRYQDRLVWLQVLERGCGYCHVSVKGLELQETSCHTVEASRIDDIIEETFEIPESKQHIPCCLWNHHPLNVMRPCDAVFLQTYSDAKNQLTGVIDSPDVLKSVASGFAMSLVWVLLHSTWEEHTGLQDSNTDTQRPDTSRVKTWLAGEKTAGVGDREKTVGDDPWVKTKAEVNPVISVRPLSARSGISDFASSVGSGWLDDDLDDELDSPATKNKINLATRDKQNITEVMKPPGVLMSPGDAANLDLLDFGLPTVDITQTMPNRFAASLPHSVTYASPHSSYFTVPSAWRNSLVSQKMLTLLMDRFPQEWFTHVLSLFAYKTTSQKDSVDIVGEVTRDSVLATVYSHLVMSCVSVLGLADGTSLTPSHVYRLYNGVIPWSPTSDWLTDDVQLLRLVLKAYRYAVKLAVDQAVLGEVTSHSEVEEYLEEYDSNWYIGSEGDPEWTEAVTSGIGQLFSLSHDPIQGVYKSRVLTMTDLPVYVSALSAEAVRAQWANLSVEMLYMTNDDEERYSIQAHTTLLRNLTVQAADPPLGYPIYSSPPLSVATF